MNIFFKNIANLQSIHLEHQTTLQAFHKKLCPPVEIHQLVRHDTCAVNPTVGFINQLTSNPSSNNMYKICY